MQTNSFATAITTIEQQLISRYGARHVLLVFDNDNTLTIMPQSLGSVGWWDWQSRLLRQNPQSPKLVATSFRSLLQVQYLLFTLSKVLLTAPGIPLQLGHLQRQGVTMIIETARQLSWSELTQHQLMSAGLLDKQGHFLFTTTGIKTQNGTTSYFGSWICPQTSNRPIGYINGVLYISGQNKAMVLRDFLLKTDKRYQAIGFIDDEQRNINAMYQQFKNNPHVLVVDIHYTKENQREQAFINNTADQQQSATCAWQHIITSLKMNLAMPDAP